MQRRRHDSDAIEPRPPQYGCDGSGESTWNSVFVSTLATTTVRRIIPTGHTCSPEKLYKSSWLGIRSDSIKPIFCNVLKYMRSMELPISTNTLPKRKLGFP